MKWNQVNCVLAWTLKFALNASQLHQHIMVIYGLYAMNYGEIANERGVFELLNPARERVFMNHTCLNTNI